MNAAGWLRTTWLTAHAATVGLRSAATAVAAVAVAVGAQVADQGIAGRRELAGWQREQRVDAWVGVDRVAVDRVAHAGDLPLPPVWCHHRR